MLKKEFPSSNLKVTRHCILYTVYSADFVFPIVSMSIQKQVPSLLGNTLPCHVVTCRNAAMLFSVIALPLLHIWMIQVTYLWMIQNIVQL